jgi:N-acyl-D-amino-acid deacylase
LRASTDRWYSLAVGSERVDRAMAGLLADHEISGGAIAVAEEGRLVFAGGYGTTAANAATVGSAPPYTPDTAAARRVQPDQTLPIASISKPITATAVLRLAEDGALGLDDPAIDRLGDLWSRGTAADPRLAAITIRDLLQHRSGWRSSALEDAVVSGAACGALGRSKLSDARSLVRLMGQQPLDCLPGAVCAYADVHYIVLGRVIEYVTGQRYEDAVRRLVLQPANAVGVQIAHEPRVAAYDAAAGWEASPIDLVRFATALDGRRPPALLRPESVQRVEAPITTDRRLLGKGQSYYGLGWLIWQARWTWPGRRPYQWAHNGGPGWLFPNNCALLRRQVSRSGFTWAAAFTGVPNRGHVRLVDVARTLWRAILSVRVWPRGDLFSSIAGGPPAVGS